MRVSSFVINILLSRLCVICVVVWYRSENMQHVWVYDDSEG